MSPVAEEDLETLRGILNCASARGCGCCVECSELALSNLMRVVRGCLGSGDGEWERVIFGAAPASH
jgi:hypothetical protein